LVGSAQAGVSLETFNKTLADGGQWLPLDPPDNGQATIGGVVSTGLAGAQKFGYGSPRNFVIGMRVVLPNGKIAKAGGRVVKNVAGYDLCKLFTGSYGTLGLISELTFKLRPLPATQVTVLAEGSFDSALKAAWSIHQAHLFPVAIELLSAEMAKKIGIGVSAKNVLLLIRFAGIEKTVRYQLDRANQLLRGERGILEVELDFDDQSFWRNLAAAPIEYHQSLIWRASARPSQFCQFISAVRERDVGRFSSSVWQAGIAEGRLRMIAQEREQGPLQISELNLLRDMAQSLGGSLIIESASTQTKTTIDPWGNHGSSKTVFKRIKDALDPDGIFSPGRF
jgi:FAD/FMN-containing dehydrogenase